MTPQQQAFTPASQQAKAPAETSKRQVGKTLDPAQLKQVGGGTADTPVRRW